MDNQSAFENKSVEFEPKLQHRKRKFGFKSFVRAFFILLIVLVYILLFGRIFLSKERGVMKKYITDSPVTNYTLYTQKLDECIDEDGMYYITRPTICFDEARLEITVRFNNSIYDKLKSEYDDVPAAGESFVFMLEDDAGNVYDSYRYAASSNIIYNFRRIIFDNIDYSSVNTLYLTVFYADDADKNSAMSVTFKVYDSDYELLGDKSEPVSYSGLRNSPFYIHD